MKKLLHTSFVVLFLVAGLNAATYVKTWVNQSVSGSMQQGDIFAWEYDVSNVGGKAEFSIYLDINNNKVLDASDLLLEKFIQVDGGQGNDGPADSSATADGIIYTELGPFGFAPADYIFMAIDQDDQSEAAAAFQISAMDNPTVQISGTLSIEGVNPPDSKLENFMIGAQAAQGFMGYWSGLTDENGNYLINLPAEAAGSLWQIDLFFDRQAAGYTNDNENQILVSPGVNSGNDLFLGLPDAYVYGDLVDEQGDPVVIQDAGALIRQNDWMESYFDVIDGHYHASAAIPEGEAGAWFSVEFWGQGFSPEYLVPSGGDSSRLVYVQPGDSIQKDIMVFTADTLIFVRMFINDQPARQSFQFYAYSDTFGAAYGSNDESGIARLAVKKGSGYNVNIVTDSDGSSTIPEGYTFDGPQWQWAEPGDTVTFRLIPAQGLIKGGIVFSPGDPQQFYNLYDINITVSDSNWTTTFYSHPDDNFNYRQYVTNGIYNVHFDDWSGNYLAKPAWHENIKVENDTINNLDFELNYRHAHVQVVLKNAPPEAFWYGFYVNTMGQFPDVYQAEGWSDGDSTYHFQLCDGDWFIEPPAWYSDQDFDTVLTITNQDTNFYLVFDYNKATGISEEKNILPEKFYVSQNYPNPFNPQTTIEFGLPVQQQVKVEIFDIAGRSIETLVDGALNAGIHKFQWNASGVASGMYFYRVQTPEHQIMKKLILLK